MFLLLIGTLQLLEFLSQFKDTNIRFTRPKRIEVRNLAKFVDILIVKFVRGLSMRRFVAAKLDSCSSLLVGLPNSEIDKLQRVQNSAARFIMGTKWGELIIVLYMCYATFTGYESDVE